MKRSFMLGLLLLFLSLPAPVESEKQPASSIPALDYIPNDVKSWKDDPFLKGIDLGKYDSYRKFIAAQIAAGLIHALADIDYDTSVYMIGNVSVSVILPESIGGSENWTPEEIAQVKSEVEQGIWWWAARQPNAHLNFIFNYEEQVPIVDEPIEQDGTDWWTLHTMQELGYGYELYGGTQYWRKGVYDYVNNQRDLKQTDWGFVVFVIDSSNDVDGFFANGDSAFASIPGPFLVMTYDNAGWGINNMDSITAHETGHIFGAADEYASSGCTCISKYGYLNYSNQNCENSCLINEPSIMKRDYPTVFANNQVDVYARGQLGWSDLNSNSVLDIIDFEPQAISNYSGREGSEFVITGSANTDNLEAINPYYATVKINAIADVEYSVNGGAWNSAVPLDGSFNSLTEGYRISHSISNDKNYLFRVRAVDRFGRITSEENYFEASYVDLHPPMAINDLLASAEGDSAILEWTPVTTDTTDSPEHIWYYNVYSDTSFSFQPDEINLVKEAYADEDTIAQKFQVHLLLGAPGDDGRCYYIARAVDSVGNEAANSNVASVIVTGVTDRDVPDAFLLTQNHPNPFNPVTTIRFELPSAVHVRVSVYNIRGELVATIIDQHMTEGRKEVNWSAKDNSGRAVSSGVYFYRLVAGNFMQTRKMVVLR